jgi:hypothetical protein
MTIRKSRAAFIAAMLFIACNSAFAQISINVGGRGPAIVTGWHGDRYYDGRRYWGRDEWNRRHRPHGWHRGYDRGHGGPGRGRDDHRGGHR